MPIVAYARVSSLEQNLDRQLDALAKYEPVKTFTEKMSGSRRDRPALNAMLDYVREGDTLVVESLSRLGRSTKDLLGLIDRLYEKKVEVRFLKESIDTQTASGRMMFTILSALAQFEREVLLERQAEGIKAARDRGKHLGRPFIDLPENWDDVVSRFKAGEITGAIAYRELDMSRATFYRRVSMAEMPDSMAGLK